MPDGLLIALALLVAAPAVAGDPVKKDGTGNHANEEFCKTMAAQLELLAKFDPSDSSKRPKYFADQKGLNATLVSTAPASLKSEVALVTRNANAAIDAQAALNAANIKATTAVLRSPEHLAAARRMNGYCEFKATSSP